MDIQYVQLKDLGGRKKVNPDSKNTGWRHAVVGGPHIATSFLKEQLIDELWLTLEPKIFGTGGNFATDVKLDINLHLLHYEKVNEQGTLITKYAVLKK